MAVSQLETCPHCGNTYPNLFAHTCRMAPKPTVQCPKCGGSTYDINQHLCRIPANKVVICKSCGLPTEDLQNHNCPGLRAVPSKVDPYLEGIENRKSPYTQFQQEFPMSERTYLAICQQQFNDHMAEVGRLTSRMAVRPLDFAVVSSLVVHMNQAQSALTKMQGILGEQEYKKS